MKPQNSMQRIFRTAVGIATVAAVLFSLVLFSSFRIARLGDEFLKELGITKAGADEKIANSFIGGYVNLYGAKNAKNIALGNRKAVVLDLLAYTKQQVSSPLFLKKYNELRDSHKPQENIPQTPEAMRAELIANAKDAVVKTEESLKKADANSKPIFEQVLADARKNLKEVEDPNYRSVALYTKNYPSLVKTMKDDYAMQLAQWEKKYPANQLLFVKARLLEFLEVTKDIDFAAELTVRNGKKYFVNQTYEHKDSRWKMAFRAGKEVVEPARDFVQKWIAEIQ